MSSTHSGGVFGIWDAPVTDDDGSIPAPIGTECIWCREAIAEGDNGRVTPSGFVEHRECSLRNVLGGIGHLADHERYCRSDLGPDAGLTRRQSALMAWDFFQETNFDPSPQALDRWRRRVEQAREDSDA